MLRKAMLCTMALAGLALAGCGTMLDAIEGQDVDAQARGRAFARAHCASCHAMDGRAGGTSANAQAPTFASIRARYTARMLTSELETSSRVGHYGMPPLPTTAAERADLAAYMTKAELKGP